MNIAFKEHLLKSDKVFEDAKHLRIVYSELVDEEESKKICGQVSEMRDTTHMESVENWAHFVRENSDWKRQHTAFINAQFEKSKAFYSRLSKTPAGRAKIAQLRALKK